MRSALACVTTLVCAVLTLAAGPAEAAPRPLDVPASRLAAALTCHGDPAHGPTPVLLVPGTTLNPDVNFDWNYEPAFTSQQRAWCAVTVPGHGMGDIQVAAEYVVHGIRTLHARAGRPIAVLGYSQGGMSPRWALKYWPDTRSMVDDLISIDGSNHGTLDANAVCALTCAPSLWQQARGSSFLTRLNQGGETWAGISYTQLYSREDEVVVPNLGPAASTTLHTGEGTIANIAVQAICPLDVADHITMGTTDAVGYAIVMDALDHRGPASAARIPHAVCGHLLMRSVAPLKLLRNETRLAAQVATSLGTYPHTAEEPPLRAYAR